MQLATKGASAEMDSVKGLKATMKWTSAADFDLAALVEKKDGTHTMVYFGEKGDLNNFPFMKLDQDAGVGDSGGDNEENMRISQIHDDVAKAHLLCWDYGAVQAGSHARFNGSDLAITVMDDKGQNHQVSFDTGEMGNIVVLATIDNTSPLGAKLMNTSKAGTLKGLSDSSKILDIINS